MDCPPQKGSGRQSKRGSSMSGNVFKVFGIAALVAAIGLSTAACKTPEEDTVQFLSGTYYWRVDSPEDAKITFSGSNFTFTSNGNPPEASGTYRISGDSLILSEAIDGSDTWTIVDSITLLDPSGEKFTKK